MVDTTGAGDSFWGGFLDELLESGKEPSEVSLKEAAAVAAYGNAAVFSLFFHLRRKKRLQKTNAYANGTASMPIQTSVMQRYVELYSIFHFSVNRATFAYRFRNMRAKSDYP